MPHSLTVRQPTWATNKRAFNLGLLHANGNDAVPKDLDCAVECYNLAAEKGFAPAMQNLAACYASLGEHGWAASLARLPRAALASPWRAYARISGTGEGVN